MTLATKGLIKKTAVIICVVTMVMFIFLTTVSAAKTTDAEINFSLKYIDSLPKRGEENFDEFLKLPEIEKMNEKRITIVKHKDDSEEQILVNEKEVYGQICSEVKNIEDMVDGKKTGYVVVDNCEKMSRQMKIAGEIYKWVAKNIKYDYESLEKDKNGTQGFRKPQDSLFVYQQKMGVCEGKADLIALMMKMAKIPSTSIYSIFSKKGGGHAYNAIYLEESEDGRNGWTLLDATWGAPKSDKELRTKRSEFIEGTDYYYSDYKWVDHKFYRTDEYANEINAMIASSQLKLDKNDKNKEINSELKDQLEKLNEKFTNSWLFTEIKLFKDENGCLKISHKTNLKENEANELIRERNYQRKGKSINVIKDSLFCVNFRELNLDVLDELKQMNINNFDRARDYGKKVKEICESIFKKYKETVKQVKADGGKFENLINSMSDEINFKLGELNSQFIDIITFKKLNIYLANGVIYVRSEVLSQGDETEQIVKIDREQQQEYAQLANLKTYFPSFYDTSLDFKLANENIVKKEAHKIKSIHNCGIYSTLYDKWYEHKFKRGGVKYQLDGKEGEVYLKLSGPRKNPVDGVKISSDISKLGIIFKIGAGIESIDLDDDMVVDLSRACDLKNVNTNGSNRYVFKEAILCDKTSGKCLYVLKPFGKTQDGIEYSIVLGHGNTRVVAISFGGLDTQIYREVRIPYFLKQFRIPIRIYSNIEILILDSDEIVNLSGAYGLKKLDITKSERYEERDGKVFDKISKKELEICEGVRIISNKSK